MKEEEYLGDYRTPALGGGCHRGEVPRQKTADRRGGESAHRSGAGLGWTACWGRAKPASVCPTHPAGCRCPRAGDRRRRCAQGRFRRVGADPKVRKNPMQRNTEALIGSLSPAVQADADGSLADLRRLCELMRARRPEQPSELESPCLRTRPVRCASLAYPPAQPLPRPLDIPDRIWPSTASGRMPTEKLFLTTPRTSASGPSVGRLGNATARCAATSANAPP